MFNCEPVRKSVKSGGYPIDNPTPPIYTKSGLAPKTRERQAQKKDHGILIERVSNKAIITVTSFYVPKDLHN